APRTQRRTKDTKENAEEHREHGAHGCIRFPQRRSRFPQGRRGWTSVSFVPFVSFVPRGARVSQFLPPTKRCARQFLRSSPAAPARRVPPGGGREWRSPRRQRRSGW